MQHIGPVQQAVYTQPPLAQPPAVSSTSVLHKPSCGNGPEPRPTAPSSAQIDSSRDVLMVDSSDSATEKDRVEDQDQSDSVGRTMDVRGLSPKRGSIVQSSAITTGGLQKSSSDLSQTTTEMADADLTPLTSVSSNGFSTQAGSQQSSQAATDRTTVANTEDAEMALAHETPSNGSFLKPRPLSPSRSKMTSYPEAVHGQKRNAAGEVKLPSDGSTQRTADIGRFMRGHSRTMSADSNGSMIAELSAQLRARLSYAAAKVERSWQTRDGDNQRLRLSGSPASLTPTLRGFRDNVPSDSGKPFRRGSSDGTITSPRLSPGTYLSRLPNGAADISRPSTADVRPSSYPRSPPSVRPQTSPMKLQHPPKLAPPVDIVSGSGNNVRRRPNPNITSLTSNYNPYPRHRRHHSEQQFRVSSPSYSGNNVLVPGTPPLRPSQFQSRLHVSTPSTSNNMLSKQRTPSQNALMEQDAIETLLFMSSPENSGYHKSSQPRQTHMNTSIEAQMESGQDTSTQGSHRSDMTENPRPRKVTFREGSVGGISGRSNSAVGLEAQAGDEIDRLLDQMDDSDSESERHPSQFHHGSRQPPLDDPARRGLREYWRQRPA
ncbi:Glycoside hydrolase 2 (Mannanase, beta-galactosidase) [Paecilomyces lecythidis]|uniref:Glycoside hydrolase 2 (Mannanase, beta-galactosidase) n=1 Tax=Paecilomyces lecythidis TaxID=3004212 RepID=A0ABR3Y9B1_9EURO